MAIKKINKFDSAVADLDEQEAIDQEKAKKVVRAITGQGAKTRTIEIKHKDGSVTTREIKVVERRKSMPVYIPESMYSQFTAINEAYGKSNNTAIVEMIRDYITDKKGVLNEM